MTTKGPANDKLAPADDEGLTIREALQEHYTATSKASELTRQLALAGIAVIWVFKTERFGEQGLPFELLLPGLLVVVVLALDLLQYVIKGEWILRIVLRQEADGSSVTYPKTLGMTGYVFYWGKIILVMVAYAFLIQYLADHLFAPPPANTVVVP